MVSRSIIERKEDVRMRRPQRLSFEDLMEANKNELKGNKQALDSIDRRLDEKKSKEVYVRPGTKKRAN